MKRRVTTIVAGACILGAAVTPSNVQAQATVESQEDVPTATASQVAWPSYDPSVVLIQALYGPPPSRPSTVEELKVEVNKNVQSAESMDRSLFTSESYAALQEELDRAHQLLQTDTTGLRDDEKEDLFRALEESDERLDKARRNLEKLPSPFWQRIEFLVPALIVSAVIIASVISIIVAKVLG